MPRHTTPHWTDGDGIGPKLTGPALVRRLKELAETANKGYREAEAHHRTINAAWGLWLEHARTAGDALLEAKRRLGHRVKWSRWRNRNFDGSKETSCHYIRVAREWDNPVVVEAREAGLINSINAFNKLIRGQPLAAKKPQAKTERERGRLQNQILRLLAERLGKLDDTELHLLSRSNMRAVASMWERMHERLKDAVAVVYGDDDRDTTRVEIKRQARRKVTKALNGKSNSHTNQSEPEEQQKRKKKKTT